MMGTIEIIILVGASIAFLLCLIVLKLLFSFFIDAEKS